MELFKLSNQRQIQDNESQNGRKKVPKEWKPWRTTPWLDRHFDGTEISSHESFTGMDTGCWQEISSKWGETSLQRKKINGIGIEMSPWMSKNKNQK